MDIMVFIDANGDEWRFQYHNGLFYGINWDKLDDYMETHAIPDGMIPIDDWEDEALAHQQVSAEINAEINAGM